MTRNPKKKRALSAEVESAIEQYILSGEWPEGFKLPSEAKLCEQFGVSRTAIREALGELRGRNLVTTLNGSGSYVCGGSMKMVAKAMSMYTSMAMEEGATKDLIEFRMMIEGAAVGRLARIENESAVETLRAHLQRMQDESDPQAFGALDMEFHLSILESSGNAFISMIGKTLYKHYQVYLAKTHKIVTANMRKETLAEHAAIIAAIETKDVNFAREALEKHLNVAKLRGKILGMHK